MRTSSVRSALVRATASRREWQHGWRVIGVTAAVAMITGSAGRVAVGERSAVDEWLADFSSAVGVTSDIGIAATVRRRAGL